MTNSATDFNAFLAALRTASFDHYKALPDAQVANKGAFEEMRAYLLDYYGGTKVEASYLDNDGQVIDFVSTHSHPGVRRNGGPLNITARQPVPVGGPATEIAEKRPAGPESRVRSNVLGADAEYNRPRDTVPLYRTTLEKLTRFKTLADLSGNRRSQSGILPTAAVTGFLPKHYATGEQDVSNAGGGAVMSVWAPSVVLGLQESYGQQWYVAGFDGTWQQTVECGWHVDPQRYHDWNPHLFVFANRFNYETGHFFFNMDGGAFVPNTGASVQPGVTLLSSQIDGADVGYQMGFWLVDGSWVFYFNGEPLGGYPLSWFNLNGQDGPITSGAGRIRFGGEVGNTLPAWPSMGSGRKAEEGYAKAAYVRGAYVTGLSGVAQWTQLRDAGSVTGPCYSVDVHNTTDPIWGSYLYYGGGGGPGC